MHACKAEDEYSDIIAQPPSRKTVSNREVEVVTEDEQAFLARQQQLLQQGGGQGGQQARSVSPMRTPQPGGKGSPRTPGAGQGSPNKKVREKVLKIN
jgi:dynein light intermediate chain 1, cytosolic